jgi:hypothetical protein
MRRFRRFVADLLHVLNIRAGYTCGLRLVLLSPPSSSTREPRPRRNMRSCDTKIIAP